LAPSGYRILNTILNATASTFLYILDRQDAEQTKKDLRYRIYDEGKRIQTVGFWIL